MFEIPKCGCNGVLGVAGTLDAFRLILELRCMLGSSRFKVLSSSISFSVRPVYLNFVPQEKKPPPVTTDGASELVGNLQYTNVIHVMLQENYLRKK